MVFDRIQLAEDLIYDEGIRESAYADSLGYLTIGVGHLIDSRKGGKLSNAIIRAILAEDIENTRIALYKALPWLDTQSDGIQRALMNMGFQLGVASLLTFKNTLALIEQGKYSQAADNALQSLWSKQTPERARRVTDLIRKG